MIEKNYTFDNETKTLHFHDGTKDVYDVFIFDEEMKKVKEEIRAVIFPESLESIRLGAFRDCINLESVKFPPNLTKIGNYAFENCVSLREISIPKGIKSIGSGAFSGCTNLQVVNLNEGLEVIGSSSFENCASLKNIYFPSTLKEIDSFAFHNVNFEEEIILPKNLELLSHASFGGKNGSVKKINIDKENPNFIVVDNAFIIQKVINEVTNKKHMILIYCNQNQEQKVVIPNSVTIIGLRCFKDFQMSEIVLPESIVGVDDGAFENCENLKELILPDSVMILGRNILSKSGVEHFHIGKGINEILFSDFWKNTSIKRISVSKENQYFQTDEECSMLFTKDTLLRSIKGKMPNTDVKTIGSYCFKDSSISEVVIPNSVETIEDDAFLNCRNLTKVVLGTNAKYVTGKSFLGCENLEQFEVSENNKFLFTVAEKGVFQRMNENQRCFSALKIGTKHTVFPQDCEIISDNAFTGNMGICEVVAENKVNNLQQLGINAKKNNYTTIYVPKSVRVIGAYAFSGCTNIEKVDLKNSNIKRIFKGAFFDCYNIKELSLPQNVWVDMNCFVANRENNNNACIENVLVPFSATIDEFGNQFLMNSAKNEQSKFRVYLGNQEIEINSAIRDFEGGKTLVTKENVILKDENSQLLSLDINFINKFKKSFNNLDKLYYKDFYKVYFWKEHAGQIPPYYIVENLPPSEISGFYNNRKAWADLVKKFKSNARYEISGFFKICHALGLFAKKKDSQEAKKFVENVLLPNLTSKEFEEMFEDFNSFDNEYNPKFALLFMKYFPERDKDGNFVLSANGKVKIKGKDFLTYFDNQNGELKSVLVYLHNDFNKLIEVYPNKQVSNRPQKESNRIYIDEKDIVKAYAFANYEESIIEEERKKFESSVGSFVNEYNSRKYDNEIFETFVETTSQNGVTQEQFLKLSECFRLGIVNFENAKDENKLVCEKDDTNNKITFELLNKSDPLGCVLGVITDCCQKIEDRGGGCVEYGMKEPNSGFVVFRYEGKIIGQAWVWYDAISKQVTLDNIEAPKFMVEELESSKEVEIAMKQCLIRLSDSFKKAMGERLKRVTIGLSFNSMQNMLIRNFPMVCFNELYPLSGYREHLTLGFGIDGQNLDYSDATKEGQVLIKDYAKQKSQSMQMENQK